MFSLEQPELKKCFRLKNFSKQELLVYQENRERHLFSGEVFVAMAHWIQVGIPTLQIVERMESQFSTAEIYYALMALEKAGCLREKDTFGFAPSFLALIDAEGILPLEAHQRLQNMPIGFTCLEQKTSAKALPYFLEYPFLVDAEPRFQIVVTDCYWHPELLRLNQEFLKKKIPWMVVKGFGLEGIVGPLFVPGKTLCYECLLAALKRNEFHKNRTDCKEDPLWIACIAHSSFARAALGVFHFIVRQREEELQGGIVTVSVSGDMQRHQLTWERRCICAEQYPTIPNSLWEFASLPIRSTDGGYRTEDPNTTYERYRRWISPLVGAVQSLTVQPTSLGSWVAVATHRAFSKSILSKADKYRHVSSGKGRTLSQAKAGALCEALERISGVFDGSEPRIWGSLEELGIDAIHPNEVMLFSEKQYLEREKGASKVHPCTAVPRRFSLNEKTDWTPLWSFTQRKTKYLPTALCYYDYPAPEGQEPFAIGNSNGCASGNTLEEAVLQGLCELIERDAVALWWYNRILLPGVDLTSFDTRFFSSAVHRLKELGRELWVLDLTFDLKIPVFVALSRKLNHMDEQMVMGCGCHPDAEIAINRAITELTQGTSALNAAQITKPEPNGSVPDWVLPTTIAKDPYLAPFGKLKTKQDYPLCSIVDLREAILYCIKVVEKKGMEVLLLNQTRGDIALPTVRVISPGLRHFWNRFAPGRLYEVPYQLGKISKMTKEEELNPIPLRI